MPLPHFRLLFVTLVTALGIIGIALFTLNPPRSVRPTQGTRFASTLSSILNAIPSKSLSPSLTHTKPKHAFVAFLEEFSGANKAEDVEDEGEEDAYFTGVPSDITPMLHTLICLRSYPRSWLPAHARSIHSLERHTVRRSLLRGD